MPAASPTPPRTPSSSRPRAAPRTRATRPPPARRPCGTGGRSRSPPHAPRARPSPCWPASRSRKPRKWRYGSARCGRRSTAAAPARPCTPASATPVRRAADLRGALTQARYALRGARSTAPAAAHVARLADLAGLRTLLAGIPADVRAVRLETVLGPLLRAGKGSHATLLEPLEVFLAHNCSWARTAEALHLHVNTVHYRIDRIRALTGRDPSRLDHKLDLRAAPLRR
ncbi:helix-turn-helix domain-containing protein [Streptomyces sp. NPDC002825]|uniref:PucR family transcriptional regulator n=1 Tax=Streptomyces sp. NPDC002825 TaxID=3154666 RepID=UPI00332CF1DB